MAWTRALLTPRRNALSAKRAPPRVKRAALHVRLKIKPRKHGALMPPLPARPKAHSMPARSAPKAMVRLMARRMLLSIRGRPPIV